MNSKQALECISFQHKQTEPIYSLWHQEYLEPIQKDLEVLAILKKYNYLKAKETLFIALDCMNKEELEIVKEWLENDN